MTTPNDHIEDFRRAVLEVIEAEKKLWIASGVVHEGALRLAVRIAALPAAPVDSTPVGNLESAIPDGRYFTTGDLGPSLVRDMLQSRGAGKWKPIIYDDSTPAPQPALDVEALVVEAKNADRDIPYQLTAHGVEYSGTFRNPLYDLVVSLRTALTTLAARLAQEKERAERAEEARDGWKRSADMFEECIDNVRAALGLEQTHYLIIHDQVGDALSELRTERDTLAAALKQERERAERADKSAIGARDRQQDAVEKLVEVEAERDTLAARLAESEAWAQNSQECLDKAQARLAEVERERDDALAAVESVKAGIDVLAAGRDGAITRADAAEKALADAQAALAGLGEVEWEYQTPSNYWCATAHPENWAVTRAIRRVLGAGGEGNGVTYGADPDAATTKEVNVDATHR